jgi:hypothetical protein
MVTKSKPIASVVLTFGMTLSLSACGTAAPSATGSYVATFVVTPTSNGPYRHAFDREMSGRISLVLAGKGRFVMKGQGSGGTITGTWRQSETQVSMTGKLDATSVILGAVEKGRNLGQGSFRITGRTQAGGFSLKWSAVRT